MKGTLNILYILFIKGFALKSHAIIIVLLLLICGSSCEHPDPVSSAEELVVLEGFLYEGEAVDHIHLGKTISFASEDTIFPDISDASVTLGWGEEEYILEPSEEEGFYHYPLDDLEVIIGETYRISITYKGQEISAETMVPARPAGMVLSAESVSFDPDLNMWERMSQGLGEIEVTWDNPENDYFYILVENIEEDPEDIELGFTPPGGARNFRFLSQPFKTDTYIIRVFLSIQQYGIHRVRLFRVNQEYADLYENREQDSRSLAEPLTNVVNGLGVFTAFSYEDAFFKVEKY